jgi:hypothetical protein
MEKYSLTQDIKVFYITATSFPDGVLAAHQKLHILVPFSNERKYFGLSRPEGKVGIVYKAATEEAYQGEAEKMGCETYVIQKGEYVSILIKNYMQDIPAIGQAFNELIAQPGIDPNGICVEWYLNNDDVRCMVRLK